MFKAILSLYSVCGVQGAAGDVTQETRGCQANPVVATRGQEISNGRDILWLKLMKHILCWELQTQTRPKLFPLIHSWFKKIASKPCKASNEIFSTHVSGAFVFFCHDGNWVRSTKETVLKLHGFFNISVAHLPWTALADVNELFVENNRDCFLPES